jgi:hypothetical protein
MAGFFGILIVEDGVEAQEGTEEIGMGRMPQPYQGFLVQLPSSFVTQVQEGAYLAVGEGATPFQAITEQDDGPEPGRQPVHQGMQRFSDGFLFHLGEGIGEFPRLLLVSSIGGWKGTMMYLDSTPDMTHNGDPGIG